MQIYTNKNGRIKEVNISPPKPLPTSTIWIDLLNISSSEEKHLENLLQIDIPTPEETNNICVSNRLYKKNNTTYLTITLYLSKTNDLANLEAHTITFIIIKNTLLTIRDIDCSLFTNFVSNLKATNIINENIELSLLTMFLENIINDTAALLEQVTHKLNTQNDTLIDTSIHPNKLSYKAILKEIANIGEIISKIQESLVSLSRMLNFLAQVNTLNQKNDFNSKIEIFLKDISGLTEHASFLSSKLNFTLDATLGLINIEQNNIIKIFSVAAVIFLPPTLIASIFGMNFKHMPGLNFELGYPLSLVLMVLSTVLSFMFFKSRNWL